MPDHETTPDNIERFGREGQRPHIGNRNATGVARCEHLLTDVDANRERCLLAGEPSSRSASGIEKPFAR